MEFKKKAKMAEYKLVSFATIVALWTLKKVSSRSPGLECSYGKILIPVTEISVTGPAQLVIRTYRIFTKKIVATRDLGNRASPVDRVHMKRRQDG